MTRAREKEMLDGIHAVSSAGLLKVFINSCSSNSAKLMLSHYFNTANINLQIYAKLHNSGSFT